MKKPEYFVILAPDFTNISQPFLIPHFQLKARSIENFKFLFVRKVCIPKTKTEVFCLCKSCFLLKKQFEVSKGGLIPNICKLHKSSAYSLNFKVQNLFEVDF